MTAGSGNGSPRPIRADLKLIAEWVEPGSRLLDIGCGDGALLDFLKSQKNVDGRGIELSVEGVNACVAQGLSVIQGDADTDLKDYPDQAFDFTVLVQTLQATRAPREVLANLVRIGRRAIVSFPNFGSWRMRSVVAFKGRMPRSEALPFSWYDTPNIHLCTIKDFVDLCSDMGITVERSMALDTDGNVRYRDSHAFLANLFAEQAVFLLSGSGGP